MQTEPIPTATVPPSGVADLVVPDGGRAKADPASKIPIGVEFAAGELGKLGAGTASVPVRLMTLPAAEVDQVGGQGLAFRIQRMDKAQGVVNATVTVDYSSFRNLYGGDWAGRLQMVVAPACRALTLPGRAPCADQPTVLGSINDPVAGTVSATLPLDPALTTSAFGPTTTLTLAASVKSNYGNFAASPLAPYNSWQVTNQTGAFSWSYPIPVPPAYAGSAPSLSLNYNSAAIDGMNADANSQGGLVADGWDIGGLGYVQRSYRSCVDVPTSLGAYENTARDLCWWGQNATITLNGVSTELINTGSGWKMKDDLGWRIERKIGASNADSGQASPDDRGEYWVVTTPDGTQYMFGAGTDPSATVQTNSVLAVPVYSFAGSARPGPCEAVNPEQSYCYQAWRWNLDRITDPNGNTQVIYWGKETNYYARFGNTTTGASIYDRAGYPIRIEYSRHNTSTAPANHWAEVQFNYTARCAGIQPCAEATRAAIGSTWPDIPTDQICAIGGPCDNNWTPTFFTTKWLESIETKVWHNSAWRRVDAFTLVHTYPGDPLPLDTDTGVRKAWLYRIVRTALPDTAGFVVGGTSATVDSGVLFGGTRLKNRPELNIPPSGMFRMTTINDEWGGKTEVTYAQPNPCGANPPPYQTNVKDCGPVRLSGGWVLFNKWPVSTVKRIDPSGAQPDITTTYTYVGAPAWHSTVGDLSRDRSYTDYRGYENVIVTGGGTRHSYQYFRGMNGDFIAPDGVRNSSLTGDQYSAVPDAEWLAGRLFEHKLLDANAADPLTASALDRDSHQYAVSDLGTNGSTHAYRVLENQTITRRNSATFGFTTQTDTEYTAYGQPSLVHDYGDTSITTDDRCTWIQYAPNDTANTYIVSKPRRVTTYDVATGACNGTAIADHQYAYDQALGVANFLAQPTKGNLTAHNDGGAWNEYAAYDTYGREITSRDYRGWNSTIAYSPATLTGLVTGVTVTNPLGHATTFTIDPINRSTVTAMRDPNAPPLPNTITHVTNAAYDPLGRLTKLWLPGDSTAGVESTLYEYSNDKTQLPMQRTTTVTYRGGGTPAKNIEAIYYTALLSPFQTSTLAAYSTGFAQRIVANYYNASGQLVRQTAPYGAGNAPGSGTVAPPSTTAEQRFTYDGFGRKTAEGRYATAGATTELWRTDTSYDGFWTNVTGPNAGQRTEQAVDARGNLARVVEHGVGLTTYNTSYTYTRLGQLSRITDHNSNQTNYTYNLRGQRISANDPDMGEWIYGYDENGNPLDTTDAANTKTINVYDKLNRPTARWQTAVTTGTKLAAWFYDATDQKGLLDRTESYYAGAAYTVDYGAYDNRDRPLSKTVKMPTGEGALANGTTGWTTSYSYDANVPTAMTMPAVGTIAAAETVNRTWFNNGQPLGMGSATATYVQAASYDPVGRPIARVQGVWGASNLTRIWNWNDSTGRLTTSEAYKNSTTGTIGNPSGNTTNGTRVQLDQYSYDKAGNVTAIMDWAPSDPNIEQCFQYDPMNRLTRAYTNTFPSTASDSNCAAGYLNSGTIPYDILYAYDGIGNITSGTLQGSYAYGAPKPASGCRANTAATKPHAAQSVTAGPAATYTYNCNGAMLTRPGQTLTWDAQRRLSTVTTSGGPTTMVYDADGNRLMRKTPTGNTLYLDGQELTGTTASITKVNRYYTFGGATVAQREIIASPASNKLYWLTANHQGTITASVDVTAGTTAYQRYFPYGGARLTNTITTTDHGFVGQVEDDGIGLDYLNARFYDPTLSRFVSVDPLGDKRRPQTLNPYTYASNSPSTRSDPTGLFDLPPIDEAIDWVVRMITLQSAGRQVLQAAVAQAETPQAGNDWNYEVVLHQGRAKSDGSMTDGRIDGVSLVTGEAYEVKWAGNAAESNRQIQDYIDRWSVANVPRCRDRPCPATIRRGNILDGLRGPTDPYRAVIMLWGFPVPVVFWQAGAGVLEFTVAPELMEGLLAGVAAAAASRILKQRAKRDQANGGIVGAPGGTQLRQPDCYLDCPSARSTGQTNASPGSTFMHAS